MTLQSCSQVSTYIRPSSVAFAAIVVVILLASNPSLNIAQPGSPSGADTVVFPAGARAAFATLTLAQMLHCAVVCYQFVKLSIVFHDASEEALSLDDLDVSGWAP